MPRSGWARRWPRPRLAADPVKIGMITTLSGPAGYLGEDVRDGFLLAMDEEGGKLGGAEVSLIVEDDGLKPETAQQVADRMIKRDGVELITGVIFSNIAPIVAPMTLGAGLFYVSPNAAPSTFAGDKCHEDYFVVSWQNDSLHEAAGIAAEKAGKKSAVALAPNYQAGKDSIAGFKRYFKGEIVDEIYTQLSQTDYAAEIAKIRADEARDGVLLPARRHGHQLHEAVRPVGPQGRHPADRLGAEPGAAHHGGGRRRPRSASPPPATGTSTSTTRPTRSSSRVPRKYGREPTPYASQGYDTAKADRRRPEGSGGKVKADKDAFRAGIKSGDFESARGDFKFGNNNHPINTWYAITVEKGDDGKLQMVTTGVIAEDLADAYHDQCPMN
ncbi:MAG: ABC transporter substrate-binding protein [Pseudorhodoplanes sp.]|nr:ABC transporter substrate-binding protein [Pseudorhodoplanes sp.]